MYHVLDINQAYIIYSVNRISSTNYRVQVFHESSVMESSSTHLIIVSCKLVLHISSVNINPA